MSDRLILVNQLKDRLYRREPVFSFEFFPPRNEKGEASLHKSLRDLSAMEPSFVSVTYGAGGSTREKTREIVSSIQSEYGVSVMAHITCYGHSKDELSELLEEYHAGGIRNFLALRGDPPAEGADWGLVENGLEHAIEAVEMIRRLGDVSIGVAGFPETHPEAENFETDLAYLKAKVDAGADFVITQMFFDNDYYFHFVHHARKLGIRVPILPGIMPITRLGQIEKFHQMCGCIIPERLRKHIEDHGGDQSRVREVGLAYCSAQCADLLRGGAPGIHFYTLNQSRACHTVYATLNAMGFWER